MEILQVIPLLVPGGAERFVVELSDELVNQGYDCSILTFYACEDKVKLKPKEGIKQYTIHKRKGFDISLMFKVLNFIRRKKFDVVHVHVSAIKYILLAAFLLPKVKFVATIHSEASREAGRSIDKWSRKLMFKFNRCTPVTISEESLMSFERFYGRSAPMIYNGVAEVEAKDIGLRDNPEQLVFVHPASCQDVKNQTLLFEAFNMLSEEYPNIKLIWIGENKASTIVFETIKQRMGNNTEYHGTITNVRDYMYSSDAMCLSSKMEGMPMTIIEAFSVGCVPLCTPVGGCINMIENGRNGFLSDDMTTEAYCSMLRTFCRLTLEERQKIKENAKQSFEKYSISECWKGYMKIYQEK